jgi:ApbE superfamily uncharacterized protein (UPF0280 family)
MGYQKRDYRRWIATDLHTFEVSVGESDLMVSAERPLRELAERALCEVRGALEAYLRRDPSFKEAVKPQEALSGAPEVVVEMAEAARACGVGPMAGVAGAVAEAVGRVLLSESEQVIVENGGDIFLCSAEPRLAAIYAGESPLSGRLGLRVEALGQPVGLCTSSGTVGHSLSFGRADAAVVLARPAALADAAATALGNRVQTGDDIEGALAWLEGVDGVIGGAVVVGQQVGAWGEIVFVRLRDSTPEAEAAPE